MEYAVGALVGFVSGVVCVLASVGGGTTASAYRLQQENNSLRHQLSMLLGSRYAAAKGKLVYGPGTPEESSCDT